MNSVSHGRFDVRNEGGEVFDPAIMSTACLVLGTVCATSQPKENVDGFTVVHGGNVERCSYFTNITREREEVEAQQDLVYDCRDLILGDWVLDLLETLVGEEALLSELAQWIFGWRGAWQRGLDNRSGRCHCS